MFYQEGMELVCECKRRKERLLKSETELNTLLSTLNNNSLSPAGCQVVQLSSVLFSFSPRGIKPCFPSPPNKVNKQNLQQLPTSYTFHLPIF